MFQISGCVAIAHRGRSREIDLSKPTNDSFLQKALNVVRAGAVALVIINNDNSLVSPAITGDEEMIQNSGSLVNIPVVCIRNSDSKGLLAASRCSLVYRKAPETFPLCVLHESEQPTLDISDDVAELSSSEWLETALERAGLATAEAAIAAKGAIVTLGIRLRRIAAAKADADTRYKRLETLVGQVRSCPCHEVCKSWPLQRAMRIMFTQLRALRRCGR